MPLSSPSSRPATKHAFSLLIAQYHQPLYSLIARSLQTIPTTPPTSRRTSSSRSSAASRSFHGDSSLRTWLYRIALHEASNQRRWWSRHKKQEITIDSASEADEEGQSLCLSAHPRRCQRDSPFDSRRAERNSANASKPPSAQLPEAFRTVVVLREIEGFAYEEIAEILDIQPRDRKIPPHARTHCAASGSHHPRRRRHPPVAVTRNGANAR